MKRLIYLPVYIVNQLIGAVAVLVLWALVYVLSQNAQDARD